MSDDLRSILDPLAAVVAARPRWRIIPGITYVPDGTEADPTPEPVTEPERTELYTAPADLPHEVAADGTVDLVAQVALLQAAVAQLHADVQIRTVSGRATLTSGIHQARQTFELPVLWDEAPLRVPTGGLVSMQPAIAWLGRTTAHVKPGSLSAKGCTVIVSVLSTVVPTVATPITYEVSGIYFFVPPFQGAP